MAEDIPVLDFFPGKFKGSGQYATTTTGPSIADAPSYFPFQIVLVTTDKVAVYLGSVNNKVPDEVDVLLANCTEFPVNDGDKIYINVDLDMDHFQVVDEVEISKTPYADNQDDKFSILLGLISVEDGKITIGQLIGGHINSTSCGIVHIYQGSSF